MRYITVTERGFIHIIFIDNIISISEDSRDKKATIYTSEAEIKTDLSLQDVKKPASVALPCNLNSIKLLVILYFAL